LEAAYRKRWCRWDRSKVGLLFRATAFHRKPSLARGLIPEPDRYRIAALKPEFDGRVKLATRRVQFRDSYVPDFVASLSIMGSAFSTSL
jgi:hypothetical protein